MMKSKRFEPIRDLVSNSAQDLGRAMSDAGKRISDLEAQLQQLKAYREEYLRGASPTGGMVNAVLLQNYRGFIDRLGEVLRQHLIKLDAARADYERHRRAWVEKRAEAETLGRVIASYREAERYAADRHEQREGDDAALRLALSQIGGCTRH